jgi:hypothetical protein
MLMKKVLKKKKRRLYDDESGKSMISKSIERTGVGEDVRENRDV